MSEEQTNQRKVVYTNALAMYDALDGALQLTYSDAGGFLSIAPLFDDQRGKEIQKGVPRYNWQAANRQFLSTTSFRILKKGLAKIKAGEADTVSFTNPKGDRTIEFSKGLYDYEMEDFTEGLTIVMTHTKDLNNPDDSEFFQFVFEEKEYVIASMGEEEIKETFSPDLEALEEWVDEVIKISNQAGFHEASRATSLLGGEGKTTSNRSSSTTTKRPAMRTRKTATTTATTSNSTASAVDDILGDDD